MTPDMTLGGSKGQDFTMASDSTAGYSNQAIPLQAHVSSSASLHNSQTILLLFLPHFYTMYL